MRKRNKIYRRARYMTLLEILLATFVLAVGIMGILSLVPVAIRQAGSALQHSTGASVAKTALTSLKLYSLDIHENDASLAGVLAFLDTEAYPDAGDYLSIPDDLLAWEGGALPGVLDNPQGFVRHMIDGEPTPYGWSAAVREGEGAVRYVQVRVWRHKRAELNRVMEVAVGNPGNFTEGEESLLIDANDGVTAYIWYPSDFHLRAGQSISFSTDFTWEGEDADGEYWESDRSSFVIREILESRPSEGGMYARFRVETTGYRHGVKEFKESYSRVRYADRTYLVGTYPARAEWRGE